MPLTAILVTDMIVLSVMKQTVKTIAYSILAICGVLIGFFGLGFIISTSVINSTMTAVIYLFVLSAMFIGSLLLLKRKVYINIVHSKLQIAY